MTHRRRLPGPGRQSQRRGVARCSRRDGSTTDAVRELHRRRRGRGRGRGLARRAADRELAPRPGRRDARPALRGAALDRLRGDAADRPLPAREGADPGLRGADAALEPGRVRPVPRASCTPLGVRCLPTATTADAAREVAESDDPTEAAIASAEAAARFGLHVIARDVGDHAAFTRFVGIAPYTRVDRAAALAHRALVRHRPPAGLALPRARAVPPARPEPRAARVAPDPAVDVPLPLRHGARRPPARRRAQTALVGDARVDARGADLRQLRGDRERSLMGDDAVREDLGRARRRRAAGRAGAALHRPPPRARGDDRRRRSRGCGSPGGRCGGPT